MRRRPFIPKGLAAAPTNTDRHPAQPATTARAGSWAPEAHVPPTVPVWTSLAGWLDALTGALRTDEGETIRRSHGPRVETVIAVAEADAAVADTATGRNVCTSHATVARKLDLSPDTVRRARYVIRDLGYSRDIVRGRYLTRNEITLASMAHGGRQRRIATTRCLTTPTPPQTSRTPYPNRPATLTKPLTTLPPKTRRSQHFSHLPPSGAVESESHVLEGVPTRECAKGANNRTPQRPKAAQTKGEGRRLRSPRPLHIQKLAAKIVSRLPWLGRHGHIGALCDVLARLPIDHHDPRAHHALIDVMDAHNRARAMYAPRPDSLRNPIAMFAATARAALAWHASNTTPATHPSEPTRVSPAAPPRPLTSATATPTPPPHHEEPPLDVDALLNDLRAMLRARPRPTQKTAL